MATANSVTAPGLAGGYPKEIFSNGLFSNGLVEEKYLCNFCRLVLKEPVQAFCGHRFCKSCIEAHISTGNQIKCTQCEKEAHDDDEDVSIITGDQIFPDNAIKREMGRLDIRCAHNGCSWTGKFRSYEEHLTMCDFKPVACPHCNQLVSKELLERHKTEECTVRCDYCGEYVLFINRMIHSEVQCSKMLTVCEVCGKQGIVREQMASHQQSQECQIGEIECPVGCGLISRKNFHDHFNQKKHTVWLIQKLDEMNAKIANVQPLENGLQTVNNQVGALSEQFTRLAAHSSPDSGTGNMSEAEIQLQVERIVDSQLTSLNERMDVKTGTFEGIASALHRELEKTITAVEKLEQHRNASERKMEQLNDKIRSLERTIALKDMSMAELELRAQSMEAVSYDGTFMWRVTEFSKKHADAVSGRTISIYSPPFYSSRRGYKMCARLYPNGDGMGKGSHLSLFFVVMRGNYDALLPWPFTRRVTFCIVNQNGGEHVIDSFRPDPQSSSFKRPTSDMNIASGCPLFIRLEMQQNPTNGFLKDDTMFLKISVDTTDLTDPISTFEDRVKPQI